MSKAYIPAIVSLVIIIAGAYLVNRDSIQSHKIKIEYIEKASKEQKEVLQKVAEKLTSLDKIIGELVVELKFLKRKNYSSFAINKEVKK